MLRLMALAGWRFVGVLIACAMVCPHATRAQSANAPASAATTRGPLEGTWRWVGGDAEIRARDAAIDRAVQGMGFIIDRIAASRLRDRSGVATPITITLRDGVIDYAAGNGTHVASHDGEARQRQTSQGESVTVTQHVHNATLTRVAQTGQGARREEYRIEGDSLVLRVTVTSPRLPRAVVYRLTYRR